jgi:type II secretory pathway pseudopilin PulG
MNKQRGVGLIEMLVVLAITVTLTAAIGQSLVSIVQETNEKNISNGLLALQKAEATYVGLYPQSGYSISSALSSCPPAGQSVTASKACLIPVAYTNGSPVFNYNVVLSVPSDASSCSSAPCDFLAVATPVNPQAGRFTYCVDNDGVLHGAVELSSAIKTAADCGALEVITAGTQSAAAQSSPPVLKHYQGVSCNPGCSMTMNSIPAGNYIAVADIDGASPNFSAACGIPGIMGFNLYGSTSGNPGSAVGVEAVTTTGPSSSLTLTCTGNGIGGMTMVLILVPVSGVQLVN